MFREQELGGITDGILGIPMNFMKFSSLSIRLLKALLARWIREPREIGEFDQRRKLHLPYVNTHSHNYTHSELAASLSHCRCLFDVCHCGIFAHTQDIIQLCVNLRRAVDGGHTSRQSP